MAVLRFRNSDTLWYNHTRLLCRATCHPSVADQLQNPALLASRVVVDGTCVTSRGPGTAVEFALKLVELLYGVDVAQAVADHMLVARGS